MAVPFTVVGIDHVVLRAADRRWTPPAKAIVLCVDEKPSIQALEQAQRLFEAAERTRLDRAEPRLQAAWHHDFVRSARSRHRKDHRGAFQAAPSCRVPRLHEQPRSHKKNERWLKKHPTVRFHFTPTRSSWLNQVETWFSILQGQSLNGTAFTAVEQLQEHIDAFIAANKSWPIARRPWLPAATMTTTSFAPA
jgi:hypothetical protein